MVIIRLSALVVSAWALATSAFAQGPVAIVEEVSGNSPDVEFMDYVEKEKIIRLGPQDSIVLSYLNSCLREVIHGGSVKVGADQSEAISGKIERTKVECEAGKMLRAVGQTNDAANMIVRGGDQTRTIRPAPEPEFTIYSLSPLFDIKGVGALVVARLDKKGEYFKVAVSSNQPARGALLDFARDGKLLTAGGVYGVRWDGRITVFKVDRSATSNQTSIVGRLVRLESAS